VRSFFQAVSAFKALTYVIEGPVRMAADARIAADPRPVTYIDFLSVTLTALCALLALLTIIIGLAAVWGYIGLRDEITKTVRERAESALQVKLGEYPDSRAVIGLFDEMRTLHEQQKRLSDQLIAGSDDEIVAAAARTRENHPVRENGTNLDPLAKNYPGEGA
jgi:hypothetical protein